MAADFKLKTVYSKGAPLKTLTKASGTVIEAGDMVALSSGVAVKAGAASAAIAFSPSGAPAGVTTVQVLNDPDAEFVGTAAGNFAVTDKGTEVDMSGSTTLLINLAASSTDVFKVDISDDAGTAGSTKNVTVRINKFLY